MPRAARLLGVLAVVATAAFALSGAATPAPGRVYTVRVDAKDFSFTLSRRSVPAGSTVHFVVRNRGGVPHDFVIKGKRTRLLPPDRSQTLTLVFPRKGTVRYLCSVPGHARLGMKGVFGVSVKPPTTPPVEPPPVEHVRPRLAHEDRDVRPARARDGTAGRSSTDSSSWSRRARSASSRTAQLLPTPFLDLHDKIKLSSEPGLLSIAFAPDYATSGLFYVFYNSTAGNGDIHISEFRHVPGDPDHADPYSERTLLTIVKPWENHNGGMLQFGPDGYLYASVGDGDSGVLHPPGFFAQHKRRPPRDDPPDRPQARRPLRRSRGQPVRGRAGCAARDLGLRTP